MRAYLEKTPSNPETNRVPWYRYFLPCYVSLFLWIGFYQSLAEGTIDRAPLGVIFLGLLTAEGISYGIFCHVPAVMGMRTGFPLGVIGSATFGSEGGQLVPGLLMGVLQVAWFGAAIYYAAGLALTGLGLDRMGALPVFVLVAMAWGVMGAFLGARGLGLISKLAYLLGLLPALVLIAVLSSSWEGLSLHEVEVPEPLPAFTYTIHLATGFFAVFAASAPSAGLHFESKKDLWKNGIASI